MKRWFAGLVVFAIVGCGGDDDAVTGPTPRTHSIRLEATWPLATHPSIIDARFYEADPISCGLSVDACPEVADFDSEGVAFIQFDHSCVPGETISSVSAVFAINTAGQPDPNSGPACVIWVDWICQEGLQQIFVETPQDDPDCQVTQE